jgi:hypothetical protein
MKKRLIAVGFAVAAMASSPANAKAPSHHQQRPAAQPRYLAAQQHQIACTVLGCQPIPAACYPKEEHSPTGIPTGFDQIVCPPGVWPF